MAYFTALIQTGIATGVRYWIPHIRIISPEGLQGEMEKELRGYLERG